MDYAKELDDLVKIVSNEDASDLRLRVGKYVHIN
jgi:hypothetical protein